MATESFILDLPGDIFRSSRFHQNYCKKTDARMLEVQTDVLVWKRSLRVLLWQK